MGTTISTIADRRGDACEGGIEEFLTRARKTFADMSAYAELELDRLFEEAASGAPDPERQKSLQTLIQQTQAALLKVLDIEAKLARETNARTAQAIDLEDARAEIDRRLARLAA
ncbi:MAG: hypothetical protein AAFR79_09985 [Pseudomonadota bacterium]